MKRILVPLDGTDLAASILPDARRLAGSDGTLILVQSVCRPAYDPEEGWTEAYALKQAEEYLENQAAPLRADGFTVETHGLFIIDSALAIDEAAKMYRADMVACATHGRGPLGRLVHGGVAWKALANSPIPVLLRHPDAEQEDVVPSRMRRIMVPLDGSSYAEQALPVARQLARDWSASLWLVQVVPADDVPDLPYFYGTGMTDEQRAQIWETNEYLDRLAKTTECEVHTQVISGSVVKQLVTVVDSYSITDIVMASHGRTGLSRVILGSVADALVHELHLPIVVVPALVAESKSQNAQSEEPVGATK